MLNDRLQVEGTFREYIASENSAILTQIECYIELFELSTILIDNNDRQN